MRRALLLTGLIAALAGSVSNAAWSESYAGKASVIDGDTIYVTAAGDPRRRVRLRLFGVDAPERKQVCANAAGATYPCGQNATDELRRLIGSEVVSCEAIGSDGSRPLVRCMAGGVDLNRALVESG